MVLRHLTKWLPCPYMVKHLKSFSRTKKALGLNLGIWHRGLKVYQVCSNDDRRLTFDLLRQGQICVPVHLYRENSEQSFLAHLSRGLRMSCCDQLLSIFHRRLSVRRPSSVVRPSLALNDFSFKNPGPIFFKLHVEPSVKAELKIFTNCYGPLIKMSTMPN